jgi:hypothetical protein
MSQIGWRLTRAPPSSPGGGQGRARDAGLRSSDIDGLSTYPGSIGTEGFSEGGIAAVEDASGRPTWQRRHGDFRPGLGGRWCSQ